MQYVLTYPVHGPTMINPSQPASCSLAEPCIVHQYIEPHPLKAFLLETGFTVEIMVEKYRLQSFTHNFSVCARS